MMLTRPTRILLLPLLAVGMMLQGQALTFACVKRGPQPTEACVTPCRTAAATSCCRAVVKAVEASSCCMSRTSCPAEQESGGPCDEDGDCTDCVLGTCPVGRWVGIADQDSLDRCAALTLARVHIDVLLPMAMAPCVHPPPWPLPPATRRAMQSVWLT